MEIELIQDELWIYLGPSSSMKAALIIQHLGGFLCAAHVLLPRYMVIVLLGLGLLWHLSHCIKKYVRHDARSSILHFSLKSCGQGMFYFRNNLVFQGSLSQSISYLSQYVIVLAVQSKAAKGHDIVLFKDSISPFAYQRLLAQIRAIPRI